jgi:hypothetical protein
MFVLAVRYNRFKFASYMLKKRRKATKSFSTNYGDNEKSVRNDVIS